MKGAVTRMRAKNRHPLSARLFVWGCDLVAAGLMIVSLTRGGSITPTDWVRWAFWTTLLCVAFLGSILFTTLQVYSGWSMALDFAAALILPFPLFCLAMVTRCAVMIVNRILRKHPEPFLGPDFNAANLIFDGGVAMILHRTLTVLLRDYPFGQTMAILLAAAGFLVVQLAFLTTLLALDQKKPWRKVGCLDPDALLTDGLMVVAGAVVARIYQFDPYLLVLTLVILISLHRMLQRINEAKLAFIDGKTNLHNYRYFDHALADGCKKAAQTHQPIAIIFADMDHLRDVNNTYGHLVGDQALVHVANAFRNVQLPGAVACRFGGEEFVLMLPGYDKVMAAEVAEQIRLAVATRPIEVDANQQLSVTISLGIASFPEDASTEEALVKAADEAVYEAKHTGRNRVCAYRMLRSSVL